MFMKGLALHRKLDAGLKTACKLPLSVLADLKVCLQGWRQPASC